MGDWGEGAAFSDDENAGEEEQEQTQDHVICLVDCQRAMFQPCGDEELSCFRMTSEIIENLLKKKIFESDKNKIGVVLFGSRLKSESSPQGHVFVLLPLETPSAQGIKQMQELSRLGEGQDPDAPSFLADSVFGGPMDDAEACPLRHGIWRCNQIFASTGVSMKSSRRIWLFTNEDEPLAPHPEEVEAVETAAKDAAENGVMIELFHMEPLEGGDGTAATPPATLFDVSKFYHKLLCVDMDEDFLEDRVHGARSLEELETRVRKKSHMKRSLAKLPFILSEGSQAKGEEHEDPSQQDATTPGAIAAASSPPTAVAVPPRVEFQVQLVITTAPTKITSIMLDGASNEQVKTQSRMLCETTGEYLDDLDVKTYMEVGGRNDRAYLSKAELKHLNAWGDPGVTVLGFLPLSWLQPWYNVRSPYFLYPDESSMKGSVVAAAALLKAMVAKRRLAVARLVRNTASAPHLVALVPQEELIDEEDGSQVDPPGFNVIVLPYADDLRDVPLGSGVLAPEAAEEDSSRDRRRAAARRLVTAISLDMVNSAEHGIHNPVLQKQYAMLQALALGEEAPSWEESVDDNLRPPPEMDCIKESVEAFFSQLPANTKTAPKRRATGAASSGGAPKRPKPTGDGASSRIELDWPRIHSQGLVGKQTVPDLKAFLVARGIGPISNKRKADLIEMVVLALEAESCVV